MAIGCNVPENQTEAIIQILGLYVKKLRNYPYFYRVSASVEICERLEVVVD